ncbi:MAG: cytochrome P450 [Gemmatimonadales bacterium]|nr:MAG: cytochrome P450 [Gemmatimonadales bacterium]
MSTPRERSLDATIALRREGYPFILRRRKRLGSDVFETRILLQPTMCVGGEEAAKLFYRTEYFRRDGASPSRVEKTLFGEGGVQGLDGERHLARKAMFMSLMGEERLADLNRRLRREWEFRAEAWALRGQVVLLDEVRPALCRAICAWSGVPLPESDLVRRTEDLSALIEAAGAVGPRHWKGRLARRRSERWIADLVRSVRSGTLAPPEGSPLEVIARYRSPKGEELDADIAAVEVLNILRPTVAVAYYLVYVALALHEHPEERVRLDEEDGRTRDERIVHFVQEVRRFYPFFPFAAAIVRKDFEWEGHRFPENRRVLLDLYGTNRDPSVWEDPDRFHPPRFRDRDPGLYALIPQGGGDHDSNHRCAGEFMTVEIMKGWVEFLSSGVDYDVFPQDLEIDPAVMPGRPASGFVIENVRLRREVSR